jgi:hypothetical protein
VRRAAAGLLLACSLCALARAQEGLRLVPRFEPGERLRYQLTLTVATESSMTPPGAAVPATSSGRARFDIVWSLEALGVAPDGATEIRAVIHSLQVESAPERPANFNPEDFIGKPLRYQQRPDGSVENLQAPAEWLENGRPPDWLRAWLEQSGGQPRELPDKPVRPGERWAHTRDLEVPGLPKQRLQSESVYLRDEQIGEKPCASVLTRFTLEGSEATEEELPEGGRTGVARQVTGGGSRLACYDLRNGRLLESTQTSHEEFRFELTRTAAKPAGAQPSFALTARTTAEIHLRVLD